MSLYSSASDYAKDTWLPVYANQLGQSEGSLLQLLGLNTDSRVKLEGRTYKMKIQVGDDLGFGMLGDTPGSDFPAAGDISSDEVDLKLHRFSDTIQFDAHEMALLNSLDAAAAPIMQKKMAASRSRVLRELERQAIMDGTGALAKIASEVGSTVTLDVAGSDYTERNPYTWIDDPKRSYYLIVDPTDGTDQLSVPGKFTVDSFVESTNVLTLSVDAGGAAAGDLIVTYSPAGYSVGGAYSSPEMTGLLGMIDDGNTYLGLNRSTAALAFWRSTVVDNSGALRSLTESHIHELMNKTARRAEKGTIIPSEYVALASPGTWTSYHNLMSSGIRYTVSENPDVGWGGRQSLNMDGVPLFKHIQAPRNQILLVHKDSVGFVGPKHDHSSIVKFVEQNGSIFFQKTASAGQGYADATLAMIAGFIGMYTERPRNHARLDDITETAGAY